MKNAQKRNILFFVAMLACFSSGCWSSDGMKLGQVTGRVTLGGEPLRGVMILFQPIAGRPSYGKTDENGEYEMRYNLDKDGVLVGDVSISLDPFSLEADEDSPLTKQPIKADPAQFKKIPKEYFGAFRTESIQPGKNVVDIEIKI